MIKINVPIILDSRIYARVYLRSLIVARTLDYAIAKLLILFGLFIRLFVILFLLRVSKQLFQLPPHHCTQ